MDNGADQNAGRPHFQGVRCVSKVSAPDEVPLFVTNVTTGNLDMMTDTTMEKEILAL